MRSPSTPPMPPPSSGPPAGSEPDRTVPWDGRDLVSTLFAGGGVGLVLAIAIAVALAPADLEVSSAAQLLILSVAIYGPLCLFGWWFAVKRRGASLETAGFRWVGIGPVLLMIPAAIGLMIVTGILSY